MIQVKNLHKYFNYGKENEIHVTNNINLQFDRTGLVCILGESGSGKTTLMNVMGGLDNFNDGTIEVDDVTVNKYNPRKLDRLRNDKFGYVFQNYYMLQEKTVAYNIMLSLDMFELTEEEKSERVDYVLNAVGMFKYKKRLVSQLSGGQQQRVAIARALVKTPEVIFADEPTGNLDEINTLKIMSIIRKISSTCLVILVTHEKRIAEFFADRIITMKDGKIIEDRNITRDKNKDNSYDYIDDLNFYLKEYHREEINNNLVNINYYSKEEKSGQSSEPLINISIIYEFGSLYINAESQEKIVYLGQQDERKIIDDFKTKVDMTDIEKFDYSLKKLKFSKTPKLKPKETFRLAVNNIKGMGKGHLVLCLAFVILSVLISIFIADWMTISSIDVRSIVGTDSHYITVNSEAGDMVEKVVVERNFDLMFDKFIEDNPNAEVVINNASSQLLFTYEGFSQIEKLSSRFTNFTYASLEHLSVDDIILGKEPDKLDEIVVDKWVLETFLDKNKIIASFISNMDYFLDKQIKVVGSNSNIPLTIVGISDTNQPNIYLDKYMSYNITPWITPVSGISNLNKATNGKYNDVHLGEHDVLLSKSLYDKYTANGGTEYKTKLFTKYNIAGYYEDEELPVAFVIDDKYNNELIKSFASYARAFCIYTEDKEYMKDYFANKVDEEILSSIRLTVTDTYKNQISQYEKARNMKVNARSIITLTFFVVAMVILYFSMKTNAIKRMKDIGVFRLIGISKESIIATFAIENLILSSYTTLPGVLLTTGVLKFLAGIPSLGITMIYPWYAVLLTILFLCITNVVIGIIPICSILKLPPAQLTAKYDI